MKITFLGQSGYILEKRGIKIAIDPYLSNSVEKIAGRPRMLPIPIEPEKLECDAVICTHAHLDHLDTDSIAKMKNDQLFITTNEGKKVLEEYGKMNVIAISEGKSVSVGRFLITAVFAEHTVEAFGVIISEDDETLYFSGDTLFSERLFEIKKFNPDVSFLCINGKLGNMNTEEALKVARAIGAKINIPNHYDMFESNSADPKSFTDCIEGGRILEFNKEYEITAE
ncbi:MAG: MBL fold metallo-hydrolase [Clostridia bacterium]|nr:MBL fold metallo-hydrolase [Clostridia bacterium]